MLYFGMCTVKQNKDFHLNEVAREQDALFFSFPFFHKSFISEGKKNEAPFIAHMCETGI